MPMIIGQKTSVKHLPSGLQNTITPVMSCAALAIVPKYAASLVMSVKNRPGAIYELLAPLARHGVSHEPAWSLGLHAPVYGIRVLCGYRGSQAGCKNCDSAGRTAGESGILSLQFIEGLFRETDVFTLAKPANWGLANILESVRARLDDAMSKLIEMEGACENE
jgi:hypothetical protein